MSAHETVFRRSMSIVGSALAVLGMFSLYENAVGAVGRLSHVLAPGLTGAGSIPRFHPRSLASHAHLWHLSSSGLAGSFPAAVGIVMAAAASHLRNGIVYGQLPRQVKSRFAEVALNLSILSEHV
jgi:hypothetical protein